MFFIIGLGAGSAIPPPYDNHIYWIFVSLLALPLYFVIDRRFDRQIRGLEAERRVGSMLDYTLALPQCASAHDVRETLGLLGNIDHVVCTPQRVWVIETKSHYLERKKYPKALSQAARNARHVEKHLETSIPVQAALVIAKYTKKEESKEHEQRESEGRPVRVFTPMGLCKVLREEIRQEPACADAGERSRVLKAIWKLGSIRDPEPDSKDNT